ncbi:hypothetical protein RCL1_002312 [Eukaryota sp. TZLM3-RCL]
MSTAEFRSFWLSVYEEVLSIDPLRFYNYHHLAYYFQYSELTKFVSFTLKGLVPRSDWVSKCLQSANDHEDLIFIKSFTTYLNDFPNFNLKETLVLLPEVFAVLAKHLSFGLMLLWLIKSLVTSFRAGLLTATDLLSLLYSINTKDIDI